MTDSVQRYFQDGVRSHIAITVLRVFEVYFYINESQIHYLTTQIHQSRCLAIICSVVGCGSCRKTKGIGIWKLPAPRNEAYEKWRLDWLNQLTISREIDKNFQRLIDNDRVYTCEKHFKPEDIEICK